MTQSPPTGELVARLMKAAQHAGDLLVDPPRPTPVKALLTEAADAITTLERELERESGDLRYAKQALDNETARAIRFGRELTASQAEVERLKLELQQAEAYWGGRAKIDASRQVEERKP